MRKMKIYKDILANDESCYNTVKFNHEEKME